MADPLVPDPARRPTGHGGWRPGAGRPRGRTTASHEKRPEVVASSPLHVTLRVVAGVPSLRRERVASIVRGAIAMGGHRDDFRVIHFNLLADRLHLIVEAASEAALARGMQGLGVRLARRINRGLQRKGSLFCERYHAQVLGSPREVRNVLRYVLLHGRHDAAERGERLPPGWIDPCSSALWFDGWKEKLQTDAPRLRPLLRGPCPVAPAHMSLLTTGWRQGGLLSVDEVPAPSVMKAIEKALLDGRVAA